MTETRKLWSAVARAQEAGHQFFCLACLQGFTPEEEGGPCPACAQDSSEEEP